MPNTKQPVQGATSRPAAVMGLKTMAVAQMLATNYRRLIGAIRAGKIPRPALDVSLDYVWTTTTSRAPARP